MSRPLRIEYPGAWYHAMSRGRRKEKVFLKKKDYQTFIELLKEASELWTVNIAAFCLMPNHYHLLIQTPKGNLSRLVKMAVITTLTVAYRLRYRANCRIDPKGKRVV